MKPTKEEISLCKQVAEKYRKDLKIGMYVWQELSKVVQMICGLDEEERNIYLVVPETGNKKVVYWNNLEGGWLTPLWTISDCLEFLAERGFWIIGLQQDEDEFSFGYAETDDLGMRTIEETHKWTEGNTPLEACLKAVLVVLEEK